MGFIVLYFAVVVLVVEIAVVLMRSTGLERDIARFQVVSLLTSTGFTTRESELILGHPIRRRIGIFLILFGVFSFAVIVSSIGSILAPELHLGYLGWAAGALLVVLAVLRMPFFVPWVTNRWSRPLERRFETEELPIEDVLLLSDHDLFAVVALTPESRAIGQTMTDLFDEEDDANLLLIKRGTIAIRAERLSTAFEAGDMLYVYGDDDTIRRRFGDELLTHPIDESEDGRHALSLLG